jgi:hypothetical protein
MSRERNVIIVSYLNYAPFPSAWQTDWEENKILDELDNLAQEW